MSTYQHILAAVDVAEDAIDVINAAHEVATEQSAKLSVVSVVAPLHYIYSGYESPGVSGSVQRIETDAENVTRQALRDLCANANVSPERTHVYVGRPADTIKSLAESIGADLIVLGTHARKGLGVLLGSTANGVVHGAPCDVLTVRLAQTMVA